MAAVTPRNTEIDVPSPSLLSSSSRENAPDLPYLEYSRASGRCELGNVGLMAYATMPYERSATHDVCRLSNFVIGDDYDYSSIGEKTGRHSSTYCDAFYKTFDPDTATCHESWLDRILSFTFMGNALLRLVRHAVDGDRCDELFPTNVARPPTNDESVPVVRKSRPGRATSNATVGIYLRRTCCSAIWAFSTNLARYGATRAASRLNSSATECTNATQRET